VLDVRDDGAVSVCQSVGSGRQGEREGSRRCCDDPERQAACSQAHLDVRHREAARCAATAFRPT
jgi:hypothetical protein